MEFPTIEEYLFHNNEQEITTPPTGVLAFSKEIFRVLSPSRRIQRLQLDPIFPEEVH